MCDSESSSISNSSICSNNNNSENNENKKGPYKPRDLFGVQLEVTSLLLEAELRKLATLQSELESSSQSLIIEKDTDKRDEQEEQQFELILAISRIQAQAEQLDREYKVHALGALKSAPLRGSGKSNRSQPAIGLKYLPKFRKFVKNPEKVCDTLLNLLEKRSDEDSRSVIEALRATGNTDIADSIMATYREIGGTGPCNQGSVAKNSKYELLEQFQEKAQFEVNHTSSVKLARIISKDPIFVQNWKQLYSNLLNGKYQAELAMMERGVNAQMNDMYDTARSILQRWVSSSGDGATVQIICKALIDSELSNCAREILQKAPKWE